MSTVSEAAERLRRVNAGEPLLDVYPHCKAKPRMRQGTWGVFEQGEYAKGCIEFDRENVSDEYLRLFPEDSGTLIDEEWLRSVGFEGEPFPPEKLSLQLGFIRITYYGGWNVWLGDLGEFGLYRRVVDDIKTRGDLRQLCRALGIEIEET